MKFENIAVGDIVYIQKPVQYAWGNHKYFWLPKKVEKITPKQFQVCGDKYRKSNGSKVTSDYGSGSCKFLGDKLSYGEMVSDQTDEYKLFINRLKLVRESKDIISNLRIDAEEPRIIAIHHKLREIKALINQDKAPELFPGTKDQLNKLSVGE